MEGVDTPGQLARFKRDGVKIMTGRAVSKLSRWVTNEFLGLKDPTGKEKEEYLKKLQKVLDSKKKAVDAELEDLRKAAIERARATDGEKIMPSAPRPELAKSPYQVRLEQQKLNAKKATEQRLEAQAKLVEQKPEDNEREKKIITEMSRMRYEGDVQSALALSFASQKKSELGIDRTIEQTPDIEEKKTAKETEVEKPVEEVVSQDENSVAAPIRPNAPTLTLKPKKQKKSKPNSTRKRSCSASISRTACSETWVWARA